MRWSAVNGAPLARYYKGLDKLKLSPANANRYITEDFVITQEMIIQHKCKYSLKYILDARATTDAPGDIPTLTLQRRRWNNGSLFGALTIQYYLYKYVFGCSSNVSFCRKIELFFFLMYYTVNILTTYYATGMMYAFICLLIKIYLITFDIDFGIYGYYFKVGFAGLCGLTLLISLCIKPR